MEQHAETVSEPQPPSAMVVVKYGRLGFIGEFEYTGDRTLVHEQSVLIETDRGIELGKFLCYDGLRDSGLDVDPNQINRYLDESGPEYLKRRAGKLIRTANPQDLMEFQHIQADAISKKLYCAQSAERLNLKMKVVCVEHLFGGERIIFYFTSESRVDFRELVRELAREYQTRIELRQIGARDEARLLADYEICGRECCCKNFLKTLRPVNMKMAKLQKATLDPSKVSGRCGRLRCCLRYEQKTYEDLVAQLPGLGTWVQTAQGVGRVKDRTVLTQLVQVAFEDDRLITFPVEELSPANPPARTRLEPERESMEDPGGNGDESDLADEEPLDSSGPAERTDSPPSPRPDGQGPGGLGQRPRPDSNPDQQDRRYRGRKRRR